MYVFVFMYSPRYACLALCPSCPMPAYPCASLQLIINYSKYFRTMLLEKTFLHGPVLMDYLGVTKKKARLCQQKLLSPQCQLCNKEQSLHHVLTNCRVALKRRQYDDRHDSILGCIHFFLSSHLPKDSRITMDRPNSPYTFPRTLL